MRHLTYGNLTSKSIQATTDANGALGFSATPTGNPRVWTYTHTYHGTIPGFITQTVVDGPRTDVTDTTTYVYDATTGGLASVTNALGHVTTFGNCPKAVPLDSPGLSPQRHNCWGDAASRDCRTRSSKISLLGAKLTLFCLVSLQARSLLPEA